MHGASGTYSSDSGLRRLTLWLRELTLLLRISLHEAQGRGRAPHCGYWIRWSRAAQFIALGRRSRSRGLVNQWPCHCIRRFAILPKTNAGRLDLRTCVRETTPRSNGILT